jgi:hypothetical protein
MDRFSEDYLLKIVVKWEAIAGIIAQTGLKRRKIFWGFSTADVATKYRNWIHHPSHFVSFFVFNLLK